MKEALEIAKETFKIVLIDDRPDTMDNHMKTIEKYLGSLDFDPVIIPDKDGSKLDESLKSGDVDIVVTDMILGGGIDGKTIIKKVRNSHTLTDILFYSAQAYDPEKIRVETGHYAFVEYTTRDQVDKHLKRLVDRNLARLKDIVFLRGIAISKVIDLEAMVNQIISQHFRIPKVRRDSFKSFVMENRNYSLEGRIQTLTMICAEMGIIELKSGGKSYKVLDDRFDDVIQKLKNLQNDRNLLAHCKRDENNLNCLISMGSSIPFNRQKIMKIIRDVRIAAQQLQLLSSLMSVRQARRPKARS